MRILYVEDQLEENISKVIRLFSKYLGEEAIKELNELDEEDYKEPEAIKRVIESTNLIEVEYRFPDALRKIIHNHKDYSLFIIDRNLAESRYEHDEVRRIDSTYNEEKYEKFSTSNREGDYLLHQLILVHKVDVEKKFFFLTAYSAKDELRGSEVIAEYILMKQFTEKNFIEKGSDEDFDRLKRVIDHNDRLNLMHENMAHLHILNRHVDGRAAESFFAILDTRDDKRMVGENLRKMRNIHQQILEACSERIPDMRGNCTDSYENVILGRRTMDWLSNNGHINSIVRNFLFSIKVIASDYASHPNPEDATTDTVNSLAYALKDVIAWFGGICSRYSRP